MWWFRSGKRVLAIGSVHLDTIALSSSPASAEDVTHVGNIIHSVGGSAYNIAANLASQHAHEAVREVAIYSILPQHSVLTEIFRYKINAAGINSKYIRLYREFNDRRVRGGGYVGILDDKEKLIRQAVVDAAMHEANIFQDRNESSYLESAIAWADVLVLDSDLAVSIVNPIADHARDNRKPLFICIGSSTAGLRSWVRSHETNLATCLSGRMGVLRRILEQLTFSESELSAFRHFVETGTAAAHFDINEICRVLKTKHVLCCNVQQSKGFALLAAGPTPYKCFFATPDEVRSRVQRGNSAGVVDGALAGFIRTYARLATGGKAEDGSLLNDATQKRFHTSILDFVEHVSESEGATPGSVISFEEQASEQSQLAKLWRLTRIALDVLPVFRYLLSIGALIIALWLIDVGLDVLRYFGYDIKLPDSPWLRMLLRR
jgi:hypothetical protein